jgi:hypothetical protein
MVGVADYATLLRAGQLAQYDVGTLAPTIFVTSFGGVPSPKSRLAARRFLSDMLRGCPPALSGLRHFRRDNGRTPLNSPDYAPRARNTKRRCRLAKADAASSIAVLPSPALPSTTMTPPRRINARISVSSDLRSRRLIMRAIVASADHDTQCPLRPDHPAFLPGEPPRGLGAGWTVSSIASTRRPEEAWCPGAELNHRHRDFRSRGLSVPLVRPIAP